ncbi:MAG: nucleotidyltransferase family protein [Chloroflexia bacterium]|nr:nucleotidyltransferase family protein [Chloroflexia bacterium]
MPITTEELRAISQRAEALHRRSREVLTAGVRRAAREGYTQRQIAAAIGRSQPEVARLLRFVPRGYHGRRLATHRRDVLDLASQQGVTNVRVFGSTARGTEGPESDIDLLVDVAPDVGLFGLARLEIALSELLGLPVDVVPASSLRDRIAEDVLNEAVPL